jgi:acetyl-CoA decarbonylase/synthase complex subunit gamma
MALTGLEIYKLLPKTNCKKCGFPTCLAFAMKLSQKGIELSACPDVSEEAKAALEAASQPPIRLVTVGSGEKAFSVGNEVVLFRHEKTFYNEPGLMVTVKDTDSAEAIGKLVEEVTQYSVERVGKQLTLNGFAIKNASGDKATFAKCVEMVAAKTDLPLLLQASDPAAIEAALPAVADRKPLLYAATQENKTKMAELALKHECPLAVASSDGLDELAGLVQEITQTGVQDLVLDPGTRGFADSLASLTQLRRLALKNFRPLGYPVITFPGEGASSPEEELALASQHIAKYAGIVVLDSFSPSLAYPLLTLRQNIYTDPQKPIQMAAGIYPIGDPKEESPLYTTTNFSLTYFSVTGEVEASGLPSWVLICDSEGLSVLTAWAAGKFDAEKIAKSVKSSGIEEKIKHRKLIIPGYVAVLMGELEDELPGWTIMVGPKDAVDIPSYIKKVWNN